MNEHIAIVFHSGYGHTARIAAAISESSGGVQIPIDAQGELPADGWDRLDAADAIVFGSATYMAGPSWQFKKFVDASSRTWFRQGWRNKLAAGFTNSAALNGDKLATLQSMFHMAQQHGMIWVGMGMPPANTKAATRDDLNNLGGFSGLLAQTPADASVDEMVAGDLATARAFGRRVVEALSLIRVPSSLAASSAVHRRAA